MLHAESVESPSCASLEPIVGMPPTLPESSLLRRLNDLHNELAYIDAYPERSDWGSPAARLVRRAVVLTEIRLCRSMLPRTIERRQP